MAAGAGGTVTTVNRDVDMDGDKGTSETDDEDRMKVKMEFRLKKRIMELIMGTSESSKDVYLEGLNHNLEIQDRICFQIEHLE